MKLNRESVVNLLHTDVRIFLMGGMLVKAWCKIVLRYQISKNSVDLEVYSTGTN